MSDQPDWLALLRSAALKMDELTMTLQLPNERAAAVIADAQDQARSSERMRLLWELQDVAPPEWMLGCLSGWNTAAIVGQVKRVIADAEAAARANTIEALGVGVDAGSAPAAWAAKMEFERNEAYRKGQENMRARAARAAEDAGNEHWSPAVAGCGDRVRALEVETWPTPSQQEKPRA